MFSDFEQGQLFGFDAGGADDRRPSLSVVDDERAEIGGRAGETGQRHYHQSLGRAADRDRRPFGRETTNGSTQPANRAPSSAKRADSPPAPQGRCKMLSATYRWLPPLS